MSACVASIPVIAEAIGEPAVCGVQRVERVILAGREAVAMTTENRHSQAMAGRLHEVTLTLS